MTAKRTIAKLLADDGTTITVQEVRPAEQSYGQRFTIMFDEGLYALAQKIRNGATVRVFLALPSLIDFTGWRFIDQKQLAEDLDLDRATVNRALLELLKHNIIARRGKTPYFEWRFTTTNAWRGNVSSFHAQRRLEQKQSSGKPLQPAPIVAEDILWNYL